MENNRTSTLESTLGSTRGSTPISESTPESTLGSTFGGFPVLASLAGRQTLKTRAQNTQCSGFLTVPPCGFLFLRFCGGCALIQKRSGDPNPQYFSKSTAVQMGGVLPYKWEAYCSTNGRRTAEFPFLRSLEARKVWRCKWGAYCRTNWRCTAVLFRQVVGVGVSDIFVWKIPPCKQHMLLSLTRKQCIFELKKALFADHVCVQMLQNKAFWPRFNFSQEATTWKENSLFLQC